MNDCTLDCGCSSEVRRQRVEGVRYVHLNPHLRPSQLAHVPRFRRQSGLPGRGSGGASGGVLVWVHTSHSQADTAQALPARLG